MGAVTSIVYQPIGMEYPDHLGDYIRVPTPEARLITDHGIEGDQKAGHQPNRQLNLLSENWLDQVGKLGYKTEPGRFGEQIVVNGMDLTDLPVGTRLQIGGQAIIEIAKLRTGCVRLEAAQEKSIEGIGSIGVLARVIRGGKIRVGDQVQIQSQQILSSDP